MSITNMFGDDNSSSDSADFDLFGGMNAADIEENPFDVPDDSYEVAIKEAKFGTTKSNKKGLTITYQITEASGVQYIGRLVSEWFQVGPYETADGTEERTKEVTRRGYLKKRLITLGVPESRMGPGFSPEDLVGIEAVIKTKKNGENVRVTDLKLKDSGASGGSMFS